MDFRVSQESALSRVSGLGLGFYGIYTDIYTYMYTHIHTHIHIHMHMSYIYITHMYSAFVKFLGWGAGLLKRRRPEGPSNHERITHGRWGPM